jgi:hypothetical protein
MRFLQQMARSIRTGIASLARSFECFFLLLIVSMLFGTNLAKAGTIDITTQPIIVFYTDGFTASLNPYPNPYFKTAEAAFANAKQYWDICASSTACTTSVNLKPSTFPQPINGIPLQYISDLQVCSAAGCSTSTNGGLAVHGTPICNSRVVGIDAIGNPTYFALQQVSSDATGVHSVCTARISNTQPCSDCNGKGNPIHPNAIKLSRSSRI